MNRVHQYVLSAIFAASIALPFVPDIALAGPPLLCHPIEIGKSESLPWGQGVWDNKKLTRSDVDFVKRALELLSPEAPTLVRMETIRRATIHAAEHPQAASDLLATLRVRVSRADALNSPNAAALFDLGYLSACFSQMNLITENESRGGSRKTLVVPEEPSPYDLVEKSATLAPDDAAIEFALALMTSSPSHPSHKQHLQSAVAAAADGSLLATNLVLHFGQKGQTLADLRSSFGMTGDADRR